MINIFSVKCKLKESILIELVRYSYYHSGPYASLEDLSAVLAVHRDLTEFLGYNEKEKDITKMLKKDLDFLVECGVLNMISACNTYSNTDEQMEGGHMFIDLKDFRFR